jgi:Fe-S-cluster containining protein
MFSPATDGQSAMPLPGLRPGVVMVGEGEDAELRDLQLGQVVKLGEVASIIVGLLDGTRDAECLLKDAARALGEELNPMGLVELLQALDRRALLDTPRARMVVAQGLVRADIAALQRLARRTRTLQSYDHTNDDIESPPEIRLAEGSRFSCHSCNRCCSEQHLLGPVTRDERDAILAGFEALKDDAGSDPSNFIPLPSGDADPQYLLRPRNGHCSYLGDDGMCRVHSVLGVDVKPAVCRLFPFRGVRTPQGWDVGMSMSCPTVGAGKGPDPTEEIRRVLGPLRVLSNQLQTVPDQIMLSPTSHSDYAGWKTWETETVARLEGGDPAEAWLDSLSAFLAMQGEASQDELDLDEIDPDDSSDTEFVPVHGMGAAGEDGVDAADKLLTALAFWAELLVGLEAADPMALRRFRSGVIRLRAQLAHRPEAASVLAENARLANRRADPDRAEPWALRDTDHFRIPDLSGNTTEIAPQADDPDVQRRFMAQALLEKRPLDYGTAGRGLLALTVFLALLRLEPVEGDELQPRLSDLSYLVHHPQLTDIFDTRAAVRGYESSHAIHAAILGIASA